jgi:glycosyltransferase involved in cell wall biosynthesis
MINYVAIVSPGDPDYKELVEVAHANGFTVVSHPNLPVSNKLNAGIRYALKKFNPDYIMNMGSDDLVSTKIWDEYRPHLVARTMMWGIDSCYIIQRETAEAYYLDLYNDKFPVGVLRMIRSDVIKRLKEKHMIDLYPKNINHGMDTASLMRLQKFGIKTEVIHTDWKVYTTGVKCNVSINHFIHLSTLEKAKPVKYEDVVCEFKEVLS